MNDFPLFRENIWANLTEKLYKMVTHHSGFYDNFAIICWVMTILFFLLTCGQKTQKSYPKLFDKKIFKWEWTKYNVICLSLFVLTLIYFLYLLYSSEISWFRHFDTMGFTIYAFGYAPPLIYDKIRFFPLGHSQLNLYFAVSYNQYIVRVFLFANLLIWLGIAYRFLSFIPIWKRLLALSALVMTPAIFTGTNCFIYAEAFMLIFVFLFLICLRKYDLTAQKRYLYGALFFANMCLYFKETNTMIFMGILLVSLFWNILSRRLTFKSFLHPIQLIRQYPFELLMAGLTITFYIYMFQYCSPFGDNNSYLNDRMGGWIPFVKANISETALMIISCLIFIWRIGTGKINKKSNPMMNDGLFLGALIFYLVMAFYFGMRQHYGGTHYMMMASVMNMMYIIINLKSAMLFIPFYVVLMGYSVYSNYEVIGEEYEKYYRQAMVYMIEQTPGKRITFSTTKDIANYYVTSQVYQMEFPEYHFLMLAPKGAVRSSQWLTIFDTNEIKENTYFLAYAWQEREAKRRLNGLEYIEVLKNPRFILYRVFSYKYN